MCPYLAIFDRKIPVYGLFVLLGVFFGSLVAYLLLKKRNVRFENYLIIGACIAGFGVVGAKLLWLITISSSLEDFLRKVYYCLYRIEYQNGGFVFFGIFFFGFIGWKIGCLISKTNDYDRFVLKNVCGVVLPLIHAFGRVGCLCAGCCYGIKYNGFLAIRYRSHVAEDLYGTFVFPVQALESLGLFVIFLVLLHLYLNESNKDIFYVYIFLYCILRFFDEFLRGDSARWIIWRFSLSQYISFMLVLIIIVIHLKNKRRLKYE